MTKKYYENSRILKDSADRFIQKHNLEKILSKYGDFKYFGSYHLNLMNRNDIDVALIVDEVSIEIVTKLIKILNQKGFHRHWIFDNTAGGCTSDPKHIVYETVYGFYNDNIPPVERWELGIVVTTMDILPDVLSLTRQVSKLPENEKETILRLKFELAEKYGSHAFTGTQIYTAVMDGVDTMEKFISYIE